MDIEDGTDRTKGFFFMGLGCGLELWKDAWGLSIYFSSPLDAIG